MVRVGRRREGAGGGANVASNGAAAWSRVLGAPRVEVVATTTTTVLLPKLLL